MTKLLQAVALGKHVSKQIAPVRVDVSPQNSWHRNGWFLGIILVSSVAMAYIPIWSAGFVWDDYPLVTNNPCMDGLEGLKAIWTTKGADICPLVVSTFWLEHALWGFTPWPYHFINLVFHIACGLMFWRVLRSLNIPGSWLGAMLWSLHPVQVQSVAWIAEMKNNESGLFFLLSIHFFLRGLKEGAIYGGVRRDGNYWLTILFGVVSIACKTTTLILPCVLLLCAWWFDEGWKVSHFKRVWPLFFVSIVATIMSIWTANQQVLAYTEPYWAHPWPERLLTAGDAVWFYLGKLVWPYPLITIYPRWSHHYGQWASYLPLVSIFVLMGVLWLNWKSWSRPWFFLLAYFVVTLLPVLGLIDVYVFCITPFFDQGALQETEN
jgi:protein O-mannosyl-transferase